MNKKKAIIIAIAAVLLIGLTSAGLIIGTRGKKENDVKAETTETMASADKEEKADEQPEVQEDVKDTEKKKGNQKAEKDTVKNEITESIDGKQSEQPKTTEQPKQTTEQKPEAEAPKTTEQQATETPKQPEQPKVTAEQPTTEKQKVWHDPVYEDVWVVDVPEYTEKQIVDVTYTEQCYCGFRFTSLDQWDVHLIDHDCAGYWGDVPLYTYEDVTIPEQGHYEQKLVKEGYWE